MLVPKPKGWNPRGVYPLPAPAPPRPACPECFDRRHVWEPFIDERDRVAGYLPVRCAACAGRHEGARP